MASQDRSRRRARGIAVTAILTLALPVALALPAAPASAAVASPNAVIVWDINAQEAIWEVAGQAPQQVSGRSFAMVSGAVYDAANAIAGTPYEPYLLVTPPLPEYPSGNTCGNGARMAVYEFFFGSNDIVFSGFSVDTGTRRHFGSFSQALAEVIDARVWGGIHFRTADVDGAELGRAVADYVAAHHFRRLRH